MGALDPVISNGHIINWTEPPALIVDERGMIFDCNETGEKFFGYNLGDLAWQHVSKLFPQLSEIKFTQNGKIHPRLGFLSRCGQLFQTQNKQGESFSSTLHFVQLNRRGKQLIKLIVRPSDDASSE